MLFLGKHEEETTDEQKPEKTRGGTRTAPRTEGEPAARRLAAQRGVARHVEYILPGMRVSSERYRVYKCPACLVLMLSAQCTVLSIRSKS